MGNVRSRILRIMPLVALAAAVGAASDFRLANAAQNEDIVTVRTRLAQNVDVDASQVDGTIPLFCEVHHDKQGLGKLKAGPSPRNANRYGTFFPFRSSL